MRNVDVLLKEIYDTPTFHIKGRKTELEDVFIVSIEGMPYVLCIMHNANLDGTNVQYSYALYSVSEKLVLESVNSAKNSIIESLPLLEGANKLGGSINPFVKNSLQKEFDVLLGNFMQNGFLKENERELYLSYLDQMQKMQSPSFAAIYQSAKEMI